MVSRNLNSILEKVGIHYGWVMAILAFMTTVFSSAALSTPSVILLSLTEQNGWKISDVSVALALMFFVLATMAPFEDIRNAQTQRLQGSLFFQVY